MSLNFLLETHISPSFFYGHHNITYEDLENGWGLSFNTIHNYLKLKYPEVDDITISHLVMNLGDRFPLAFHRESDDKIKPILYLYIYYYNIFISDIKDAYDLAPNGMNRVEHAQYEQVITDQSTRNIYKVYDFIVFMITKYKESKFKRYILHTYMSQRFTNERNLMQQLVYKYMAPSFIELMIHEQPYLYSMLKDIHLVGTSMYEHIRIIFEEYLHMMIPTFQEKDNIPTIEDRRLQIEYIRYLKALYTGLFDWIYPILIKTVN